MKTQANICARMKDRLVRECESARSIKREMQKLEEAHNRYTDLKDQLRSHRHRIHIIVGLFGSQGVEEIKKADATASLAEALADESLSPQELRGNLRLWRAVRECVRLEGESTINDLQEYLTTLGLRSVTRQAIESALKQHEEEFEVTKRGKERYVALR